MAFLPFLTKGQEGVSFSNKKLYLSFPSEGMPADSSARTLEFWLKTNYAESDLTRHQPLVVMGKMAEHGSVFSAYSEVLDHKTYLGFWGHYRGNRRCAVVPNGTWHFAAYTYDGDTLCVFLDGILKHKSAMPLNTVLPKSCFIGGNPERGWFNEGHIRDVVIWNTARSEAEVKGDMLAFDNANIFDKAKLATPGLIAYFPLNNHTGGAFQSLGGTISGEVVDVAFKEAITKLGAAFLFLLMMATAVIVFFKLRNQRLQERQKELEKIVEERTQKILADSKIIEQQSEVLKNLDAAKSRFFANVSHELRTPLTLLLGPIKILLKENQFTEKQTRLLQTAHQSGRQLQQLVNEILDLQKLEMGKMELHEKPTGLASFFGRYAAQFESLAHRKQIDYSFETTVGDEVVANIDQEKCRQIIYNLLSNAFKFTPESGRIKVSLSFHKDTLQLEVADTGPGIHPDDLPHVFDRFFQTNRPDKPAEGGTGIGLALCHEYAHLFGGKIEVESTLGKGSAFQVAFPIKVDESGQLARSEIPMRNEIGTAVGSGGQVGDAEQLLVPNKAATTSASDEPKPTILVVEDNPELQDYIRLILEEKYNVLTADNGQAALNRLLPTAHNRPPHTADRLPPTANCQLILSDLMMPVMDGYQLLEKLKSDDATRHIPVIMLTARAEARDKLRALRIGVDDYLTKPFDEEELLARIENLLRNQAARQQEIPTATEQEVAAVPGMSEADRTWLETFEAHAQKHLSDDIFNIPLLAQEFAMSHSTLLRQLKRLTGLTPVQYLQEMRLDHARHLLETRSYDSIAKVASEVGYVDTRSFSRSFKQRFGKMPSDYLSN